VLRTATKVLRKLNLPVDTNPVAPAALGLVQGQVSVRQDLLSTVFIPLHCDHCQAQRHPPPQAFRAGDSRPDVLGHLMGALNIRLRQDDHEFVAP